MSDKSVRCGCEWCSPETGRIHAQWPMVLDPYCPVHSRPDAEREAGLAPATADLPASGHTPIGGPTNRRHA